MMKQRTRNILIFVIFLICITIFFLGIWRYYDYLESLIGNYIEDWGYIGVFVISFLADVLEQPVGPGVPVTLGIIFNLKVILVVVFAILGSTLGSFVSYFIGKKYFSYRLREVSKGKINKKHYKLLKKYGGPILALAAISPIPWVAFCWLAGGFKITIKKFFFWGIISRMIRIIFIASVVWYTKVFA